MALLHLLISNELHECQIKNMSDICEYLGHEANDNRSQIQTPCGPISFAVFQALWSQSTTLTLGNKETHCHVKY